jgi:hypothetical protein
VPKDYRGENPDEKDLPVMRDRNSSARVAERPQREDRANADHDEAGLSVAVGECSIEQPQADEGRIKLELDADRPNRRPAAEQKKMLRGIEGIEMEGKSRVES